MARTRMSSGELSAIRTSSSSGVRRHTSATSLEASRESSANMQGSFPLRAWEQCETSVKDRFPSLLSLHSSSALEVKSSFFHGQVSGKDVEEEKPMTANMTTGVDASLTIGAVARRAGVAASAIRYYETIGLLPTPIRLKNGQRRYEAPTVQRLRVIERAQQAGFTLGEIRELFFGFAAGTHPNT